MMDFLATLIFLGFFAALIYSTVLRKSSTSGCRGGSGIALTEARQKATPPATIPPSPVGLYCSICHDHADVVSSEEYERLSKAGVPIYCRWCMITIEAYKQQRAKN